MEINSIPDLKRVAFIGNYLPRQCGIATFTTDLSDAFTEQFPDIQSMVIAMNDTIEGYTYCDKVRYEIRESNLFDYERAANFLKEWDASENDPNSGMPSTITCSGGTAELRAVKIPSLPSSSRPRNATVIP